MANVKLIIQFPHPHDVYVFDKSYTEEHIPLLVEKLAGKTKIVETTPLPHTHHNMPTYHRTVEVYFPSMETLLACTESAEGKEVLAHAAEISTGDAPNLIIAEEESTEF